ncbi:MAG: hypothetical protein AB8B63_01345 [Granulosicoccus sp.]
MQRRHFLKGLLGSVCAVALSDAAAHTPYRQWQVYRRKHLLVGCHKDAPATYTLAKQIVANLDAHLPDARARVARAPTAQRIASLMATDQMDVAIVSGADAVDMAAGTGQFAPFGAIALRQMLQIDNWVLVCREDIPDRHTWLITDALLDSDLSIADELQGALAWHPGAHLRLQDAPLPE